MYIVYTLYMLSIVNTELSCLYVILIVACINLVKFLQWTTYFLQFVTQSRIFSILFYYFISRI